MIAFQPTPGTQIALSGRTSMNHPNLVASLVEDRRRRCPCGVATHQPDGLCRECQAVAAWRRETTRTNRRTTPTRTHVGTTRAGFVARLTSLVQVTGKGAEN